MKKILYRFSTLAMVVMLTLTYSCTNTESDVDKGDDKETVDPDPNIDPEIEPEPEDFKDDFLKVNSVSAFVAGETRLAFDKQNYQISYAEDNSTFTLTNYDSSSYFELKLEGEPQLNATVVVDSRSKGFADGSYSNLSMSVIKVEKDMFWLWSSDKQVGFVINFE